MKQPAQEIHDLVYQMMRVMQSNDRDTCGCFGVTHLQGLVLIELAQRQPLNMQQLAQQMQLAVSTMSRVVDKLVSAGLVDRREDKDDRRAVSCSLTEEGQKIAGQLCDCYTNFFAELVDEMDSDDLGAFVRGLKLMVQKLQCYTQPGGCKCSS